MITTDDTFVDTAISSVVHHQIPNLQSNLSPILVVFVRPSTVTTNYILTVEVSFDNATFRTVYTSATITNTSWRRVVFSASGAASDADGAAANATINKSPILEPFVQVSITPTGSFTAVTDVLQMMAGRS